LLESIFSGNQIYLEICLESQIYWENIFWEIEFTGRSNLSGKHFMGNSIYWEQFFSGKISSGNKFWEKYLPTIICEDKSDINKKLPTYSNILAMFYLIL